MSFEKTAGLLAVVGLDDLVAVDLERRPHQRPDNRVVIDDQHR